MRAFVSKISWWSVVVMAIAALSSSTVLAAKPASAPPVNVGNDISWPQCGKAYPKGQAFGIVGVNNGLANNSNPCFASQLAWAQQSSGASHQDKAALYVNTANPGLSGTWWPSSNDVNGTIVASPYGTCDHTDTPACAYVYGYAKAYDDAVNRNVTSPQSFEWWLDVETTNSWEANKVANTADLEGMTAYFQSIGARVGIYSTGYQWGQIVGTNVSASSNLNNLQSWLAGARSLTNAQAMCTYAPLTQNSPVVLTQYISNSLDYDYSCS